MEVVRDVACPTCGRLFNKFSVGRHKPNCPDKPENRALVAQWLPDPASPGFARTELCYQRDTPNKPCSASLRVHFGKWSQVAEAFGLVASNSNDHRVRVKLAATEAELRRISKELHGGQYGPTRKEYFLHRKKGDAGTCAIDVMALNQRFGEWVDVLGNFGLSLPPEQSDRVIIASDEYRPPFWFVDWFATSKRPHNFSLVEG